MVYDPANWKRELIALLNLSSWCLVMVERLFLAVQRGCLQFVIVVFPDHTHLLFFIYRQIVGIPMGTNCAPLVADLFLFCYERDFMFSLSDNTQTDIIEAFNSTSRDLDDLLNIDNPYFEQMVGQIYPTELPLNKANSSDTEAPFWTWHQAL